MKGSEPSLVFRGLVNEAPRVRPKMAAREAMKVNKWRMVVVRWGWMAG